METFASQTSFYGLVPGLPDFLNCRISIGSWFGVSTIDLVSAGIPKLLGHLALVTAPFFLPSCPFMLKYVVFLQITRFLLLFLESIHDYLRKQFWEDVLGH